jgi:hypothetical protein
MKRSKNIQDKSAVYRSYGISKITAPTPLKADEPKGSKIVGKGDLRGGRG